MVALTSYPATPEAEERAGLAGPDLGAVLTRLCREQLALRPHDPYLVEHASPGCIRNQVRTCQWYLPLLPRHGTVLEWGCNHAPDSCLIRTALGPSLELHGCDFRAPDHYRPCYDYAGLTYTPLVHIYALPYPGEAFDVVLSSGTLEHVAMDYESLKEIWRVLKPDGTLIVSYLPNRWSIQEWWRRTRRRTHHKRLYSLMEIRQLLKRSGLYPVSSGYHTFLPERLLGTLGLQRPAPEAFRFCSHLFPARALASTLYVVAKKVHSM